MNCNLYKKIKMIGQEKFDNNAYAKYFKEKARSLPTYDSNTEKPYLRKQPTRTRLLTWANKMKYMRNPRKIYNLHRTRDRPEIRRALDVDDGEDESMLWGLLDEATTHLESLKM